MEINSENKAKFFAQYLFQRILMWHDKSILYAIDGSDIAIVSTKKTHYFLILKPLTSISDKDRIEAGNILQVYPEDVLSWLVGDCSHEDFQSPFTFQHAIDFLRSKGYAIPWMGLSVEQMVEAGWIKLQEA